MEPIKQEIINNIFENGDKLITGPILQTVLIDMIDDVNVKDQEILSKTGSWDNAVTQIPNLATKEEVTNLSESVARDLENVVDVDLTGYATETWVESQGYLKEHQDISNLATKTELTQAENNLQGNITSLSESVARDLANVSVPEGVATEAWVQSQDYASKSYVDNAVSSSSVDLTGYATETWVESQGYLKEHQDISNLATKGELNSVSESIQTDISNLATKGELTSVSQSVQTDITNLSESVANSTVWKKGTGTDSIVQKLSGDNEAKTPTATGTGSVAIGSKATASGQYSLAEGENTNASGQASHAEGRGTKASGISSHAEGFWTEAPGNNSHAEGGNTEAKGNYSHAEGWYASTTNNYEHAQGQYNHSSTNQIFSVGAGENAKGTVTRRNAVSILAVPNSETQILTSSFFVQNVGGYDGTNPTPGTNDLATVVSKVSSIWKKGTGTDSIVQVWTGDYEAFTSTASGQGAIAMGVSSVASGWGSHAEGANTKASGQYSHAEGYHTEASNENSHAEGYWTKALGQYSHAEGRSTKASGSYSHAEGTGSKASGEGSHAEGYHTEASGEGSHAEGYQTSASNDYEHVQGIANHNSTNQIFSVGAGEVVGYTVTRRNAISILAVPNAETQINTASFFVQNVGGYDGTNPEPGTNDLATVINNLPSGGGSSETIWKKGTGKDSAVLILTGDDEANMPTATGKGAIATGKVTNASGDWSHAEGQYTKASEWNSHAEGMSTNASGMYSHAEGDHTKASGNNSHAEGENTEASGLSSHAEGIGTITYNVAEHAQGQYNYTSSNQIFSVGAGEMTPDYNVNRRNAVSILVVPNADTKINTSSFFVQNIGGYDGTNPTPGTNDLATVLNNTETWTFTLEDGSTVTKNVRIS